MSVFRSTKLYTVSIAYQYLKQKMLYTTMYNLLWLDINCSLCKADKVAIDNFLLTAHTNGLATAIYNELLTFHQHIS